MVKEEKPFSNSYTKKFPHLLLPILPTISRTVSGKVFVFLRFSFSLSILGIYLLSEAMHQFRMNQFLFSTDLHCDDFFHNIRQFNCAVTTARLKNNIAVSKWNYCIDLLKEYKGQLVEFTRQESQKSKSFE